MSEISELLAQIKNLEIQTKDPTKALRCYPRKPEDGRIAWHHTALDILRLVNATNKPYTGAFCEYEGEKMVIWTASIVCDDEVFCYCGRIISPRHKRRNGHEKGPRESCGPLDRTIPLSNTHLTQQKIHHL